MHSHCRLCGDAAVDGWVAVWYVLQQRLRLLVLLLTLTHKDQCVLEQCCFESIQINGVQLKLTWCWGGLQFTSSGSGQETVKHGAFNGTDKTTWKCDRHRLLEWKLTFNKEEEAQDPSGSDDESRDDEGHSPRGGDKGSSDERPQDVSHRGVRVPHAHDESPPDGENKDISRHLHCTASVKLLWIHKVSSKAPGFLLKQVKIEADLKTHSSENLVFSFSFSF